MEERNEKDHGSGCKLTPELYDDHSALYALYTLYLYGYIKIFVIKRFPMYRQFTINSQPQLKEEGMKSRLYYVYTVSGAAL